MLCMATLGSSMGPHLFNVVDFGAVGDGITDDSKVYRYKFITCLFQDTYNLLVLIHKSPFLIGVASAGFHESMGSCLQSYT